MRSKQSFTNLLPELARLLRRRYEGMLDDAGLGVTAGEARTLRHVSRAPGASQAVIAERMGIEPMTLVGFLDRLESRGLVRRVPNPTDRRAKHIELTEAAVPILERVDGVLSSMRKEATAGIPQAELDVTSRSLDQMKLALTRVLQTQRSA